jgi:hypothetical protein
MWWQSVLAMSLAELKDGVLALPANERHEFVAWVNRLEANYGDVPSEALDQGPREPIASEQPVRARVHDA